MNKIFRVILVVSGVVSILFAIGFFLQMGWATQVWPFQSGRLSNIFLSSILAAIGVPVIWIGLTGELRAMAGGALNLLVTFAGFAATTLTIYSRNRQLILLYFGIMAISMAVLCIGLFFYSQRRAFEDTRPTNIVVRISFLVFAALLLVTATFLVLQRPNTFPWPLSVENSVMYGWFFLGAMCYFLYGFIFPVWNNARGQLLGFLAYDLILIVPFVLYFPTVAPEFRTSLIIYTSVVSVSGLLALYFLFLHPATRFGYMPDAERTGLMPGEKVEEITTTSQCETC
jgi:hypothetical protein